MLNVFQQSYTVYRNSDNIINSIKIRAWIKNISNKILHKSSIFYKFLMNYFFHKSMMIPNRETNKLMYLNIVIFDWSRISIREKIFSKPIKVNEILNTLCNNGYLLLKKR